MGEGQGEGETRERMQERLLKFAKSMRHKPTDSEAAMWKHLRAGRLSGFKFKRQQPIGTYIVDFVCFEHALVVEIDGGQHVECTDAERSRWLEGQGFRVLRFWNNDVLQRADDVLEMILGVLRTHPSPQPLSHKGRGANVSISE